MSLRYDDIADILKIIDSSSCDEVVIETGDLRLMVRRNGAGRAEHVSPTQTREVTRPVVPARGNDAALSVPRSPALKKTAPGHLEITAPMVGIFYRAPSPNDAPFVEVGSLVEVGQQLCLIEVMKLFTTISSEVAGRIVEINAENGGLVEYGQTLFVIDPT